MASRLFTYFRLLFIRSARRLRAYTDSLVSLRPPSASPFSCCFVPLVGRPAALFLFFFPRLQKISFRCFILLEQRRAVYLLLSARRTGMSLPPLNHNPYVTYSSVPHQGHVHYMAAPLPPHHQPSHPAPHQSQQPQTTTIAPSDTYNTAQQGASGQQSTSPLVAQGDWTKNLVHLAKTAELKYASSLLSFHFNPDGIFASFFAFLLPAVAFGFALLLVWTAYASRSSSRRKHALTLQLHTAQILAAHATLETKNKALQDIKEQKNRYELRFIRKLSRN